MYLIDHLLIIRALILRNIRQKYLQAPAGFFVEFLRPSISCVAHYYIFWAVNRNIPAGISLEQFVWAAFVVWYTFSQVYRDVQRARAFPAFPGVSAMHVRLGYCTWEFMIEATFCYGSVALMMIFGDNIAFPNVPLTALILLLAAAQGLGLGMAVGTIARVAPLSRPLLEVLPWILFISSGIYYSVSTMPQVFARLVVYFPVLHLVEYERYAFEAGYPIAHVSLWYPTLWAAGLLLLGLALSRRLRYRVAA
jgi:ABC-type polysaccharide/polyol phosphate export permease